MKEQFLSQVDSLLGQLFSTGKIASVAKAEQVIAACNRIKDAFSELADLFPENIMAGVAYGGMPDIVTGSPDAYQEAHEQAEAKYSAD